MILKPWQVGLVMEGRKTMHRRLVQNHNSPEERSRYKPGRLIPIQVLHYDSRQGRSRPGETRCRIKIENSAITQLGDISFEEARREGFRTTDEFKLWWVENHDKSWWEGWNDEVEEEAALERFNEKWTDRMVWVLHFSLDASHEPRLLAARPGSRGGDYTRNPARSMRGEPEALSESDHKRHVQDRANLSTDRRQREYEATRAHMKTDEILREELLRAEQLGVNVRHHERLIRSRIENMRRAIDKRSA